MGNQLVSSVKTVIRPIDYYLAEESDLKYKCSLGQTQFLKVALCSHDEGDVVVKVLSHEDPSLLLEVYKRELEAFAKLTTSNASIAAFRIVELRTNFAYTVRQFVRFSLYDRLSTRPFLIHLEKCWITYQLFKCMAWCHDKGLRHGDLKLENILVTSNLWVVLADFANYKPVNLPEDNPSYFNYFFDTSRRRCSNIAPERFVSSAFIQMELGELQANLQQSDSSNASFTTICPESHMTDKMDMFSIGCVLVEIFSDAILFNLSDLLAYKEGKMDYKQRIEQINNETIRDLVTNLTNLDPTKRKSCDQVLTELKGTLFPAYFDKLYVLMRTLVRLPPDAKILCLSQEIELYLPMILDENPKGVLILLTSITSTLRSLKHVYCKLEAQRLICFLVRSSSGTMSPFITDRLIPYLANCLHDSDHRVRGEAILSITELLEQVTRLATSEHNFFTDYLMEILARHIPAERSEYVRLCMAKCIGRLSRIALAFLNQSCDQNYDEELKLLHLYFQSLVSHLLTDSSHAVRRTLLLTPDSCSNLCIFFGRQKTNEVILSHIITFLNDKDDYQLRLAFFENIIVIASYLGVQCAIILYPLLQQGLCDSEEIIIYKTILAIAALMEQGLLHKALIYELIREVLPLLSHPNQWIIHAVIYLLNTLPRHLSYIDIHCRIVPLLTPYTSRTVHSLTSKYLLLDSLNRSLPRPVYDIVVDKLDYRALNSLYHVLSQRNSLRKRQTSTTATEAENPAYKRLLAENITDLGEEQLLMLKELVMKIHRNRRHTQKVSEKQLEHTNELSGYDIEKDVKTARLADSFSLPDDIGLSVNQEWQHMFGPTDLMGESALTVCDDAQEAREVDYSYFECPPYSRDVRLLLQHKKNSYIPPITPAKHQRTPLRPRGQLVSSLQEHKSSVNQMARLGETTSFFTCSDDGTIRLWDLAGFENRYVINRSKYVFKMEFANGGPINFKGVVCCGDYLVTYTAEGIVYVFETGNESGLTLVCSFKAGGSSKQSSIPTVITSLTALSAHLFAVSLTDSMIYGYDTRFVHSKNFFVPVFKAHISPNRRTISSIDGYEYALFVATSNGYIAAFDLRFHLKVNSFAYSAPRRDNRDNRRIARIKYTPEGLYSSVYGSAEVTLWDYKLGQKGTSLLPAPSRVLPSGSSVMQAILPLTPGTVMTGGSDMRIRFWDLDTPTCSYIVSDPLFKECNYCTGKPSAASSPSTFKSKSPGAPSRQSPSFDYLFGGTSSSRFGSPAPPPLAIYTSRSDATDQMSQVIEETDQSSQFVAHQSAHCAGHEQQFVSSAHHDSITDLLRVNSYIVSSGRNGGVKVWR